MNARKGTEMAKNTFPGLKTGGGVLSKVVSTLIAVAVLTVVVKHPTEAAGLVTGVAHAASSAIDGLSTFLQHLIG